LINTDTTTEKHLVEDSAEKAEV